MSLVKVLGLGTASLMIHGALLFSLEKGMGPENGFFRGLKKEASSAQKRELQFEFVETPHVAPLLPPEKAKKISTHDALNQDLEQNKETADSKSAPAIKAQGKADQLQQIKNEGARAPQAATEAKKPQLPAEAQSKDEISMPPEQRQEPQQASESQAPVKGLTGQDRITTQEMSKIKSPGAALFGVTSFEATGSGMGAYMKNLKEKIWLSWFPYLAFQYPRDFRGADAVISMTLNADGELTIVRVVDDGGNSLFASYCMQAVQKAAAFGPIPKEILALTGKDNLELKFGFHIH